MTSSDSVGALFWREYVQKIRCEHGAAYDHAPLPEWSDLPPTERMAIMAGAEAVAREMTVVLNSVRSRR